MSTKLRVSPENVKEYGEIKSEENFEFRMFLKHHADEDKLDEQFKTLHDTFFKIYDCTKCGNCCKELRPAITFNDVNRLSKHLGTSKKDLIDKYFIVEDGLFMKNSPCDFLKDERCIINDYKPESCKKYPYTDEKDRLSSMWSIVNNAEICPVVYEIIEELKEIYNFSSYK